MLSVRYGVDGYAEYYLEKFRLLFWLWSGDGCKMKDDEINQESHRMMDYLDGERGLKPYEAFQVCVRTIEAIGYAMEEKNKK